MKRSSVIEFIVEGKPPRKRDNQSIWKHPTESLRVALLREKASEACKNVGLEGHFNYHPVKLEIMIFASNITARDYIQKNNDDPDKYVGDLDSFITGICDSLKPINLQVKPGEVFQGREDIDPVKPIILKDDSQIVSIVAKKIQSNDSHYVVRIESV